MCPIFLIVFKNFPWCLILSNLTMICLCAKIFVSSWNWAAELCRLMFLIIFGNFSVIISFTLFFCSFLSSASVPFMHVSLVNNVPHCSKNLFIFLHSFFFCFFDYIISISLSSNLLILSSVCSKLLVRISSEFLNFSYCLFQIQNFSLILFYITFILIS